MPKKVKKKSKPPGPHKPSALTAAKKKEVSDSKKSEIKQLQVR